MYGALKPKGYLPRLADGQLERALRSFGGVEVCGARWTGKSWTASAFGGEVLRVDENVELYQVDPALALVGERPLVIDEWQDVPAIWNLVRHRIDDTANRPGQFILTGSSSPRGEDGRHSGAGRMAHVRMRTMTLAERGLSSSGVSLAGLFAGDFEPVRSALGLDDLARAICRGGWPALANGTRVDSETVAPEYLEALFDVSMPRAGKSPQLSRRIARSLARNVATGATLRTIALDAASGDERRPDTDTVASYLDEFARNYVIDEVRGWDAPVRSKSRLRTRPKRYFEDPSLAAALLGVDAHRLLRDGQLLGLLFESLCMHDLAAYASTLPGAGRSPLHYYADSSGHEVDAIIELVDGRWAGIEIKLGENKVAEGVANLVRLRDKIGSNPAARNREPAFLAVVVGKGVIARYLGDEGVYVIPIDTLGP